MSLSKKDRSSDHSLVGMPPIEVANQGNNPAMATAVVVQNDNSFSRKAVILIVFAVAALVAGVTARIVLGITDSASSSSKNGLSNDATSAPSKLIVTATPTTVAHSAIPTTSPTLSAKDCSDGLDLLLRYISQSSQPKVDCVNQLVGGSSIPSSIGQYTALQEIR
jgi:hypothetical protein